MDFIGGVAAGINQVIIGHPFDTVKILIQNNKTWSGLPYKDYYRGWKFPMVSSILFNTMVFSVYERTVPYTKNNWVSGAFSGMMASPIVYVFDMAKITQQIKQPLDFAKIVYNKGKYAAFARETSAMSVYFGSYHECRKREWHPLAAGGTAGLVNWTLTYPIDVIMSRQMAQNISMKEAFKQGNLYRGYSFCAARAIIVNATNFYIYEKVKDWLK
jgi:solute carrier family 25 carnitine/acylcarnitine transporter 20/29